MAGGSQNADYRARLVSALKREHRGSDSFQTRKRIVEDVRISVTTWVQDPNGPSKLVMPLKLRCPEKTLSFNKLEGREKASVHILEQALAKVNTKTSTSALALFRV